jgi:hypothetical protein
VKPNPAVDRGVVVPGPKTVGVEVDPLPDPGAFRPVGRPSVVVVSGVTGIFTPVTATPGGPLTEDERKNYQTLLLALQKQLAALEAANAALTAQLEALRNPPRSPEDFATAVQQSVDELQQRLSTTRNPVSSFALKDFRLEAQVMVDVSPLGTIEYRFARPGEPADPATLSRITLELVPLPKSGLDHTWTADLFQADLTVGALPSIEPQQSRILEDNHIFTIGEFLQVGTRARAAAYLVALLGVERARLSAWVQQAELLTLKGTNGATVLVLIAAGFPSLQALAAATPEALLAAYQQARQGPGHAGSVDVTLDQARQWVAAARRYTGTAPPTA